MWLCNYFARFQRQRKLAQMKKRNPVFDSDFRSDKCIDIKCTGDAGYQWYIDRPFGWVPLQQDEISVSDGVLTINPKITHANWQISTYSVKGKTGRSFQFGYFEAEMHFDPNLLGKSDGWPSFWGESKERIANDSNHWAELDFYESSRHNLMFYGTLHDWNYDVKGNKNIQNSQNKVPYPSNPDLREWHTYGALWESGSVTWYFDGKELFAQNYSTDKPPNPIALTKEGSCNSIGTFSILDSDSQVLVLGTGVGWPLQVRQVRVWQ